MAVWLRHSSSAVSHPCHQLTASFKLFDAYGLCPRCLCSSKACFPSAYTLFLFSRVILLSIILTHPWYLIRDTIRLRPVTRLASIVQRQAFSFLDASAMIPTILPDLFECWAGSRIRIINAPYAFLEGSFAFNVHSFPLCVRDFARHIGFYIHFNISSLSIPK